jgi:tetratricopeptide (TPR) repeat protein
MKFKTQIALAAVLLITGSAALADDRYHEEELPFGYVRSMDAFNGASHPTADSLLLSADMENKWGHHDKAIALCQQALALDPSDADLHLVYAESLEKKLRKQQEKDPNLFMTTVREWLIISRGEVGEEAGLSDSNGRHIPFATHMFADEDRAMPAAVHLKNLVGYLPKGMESDSKYLHRVYMSTRAVVKGKILKKQKDSDDGKKSTAGIPAGM